VAVVVVGGHSRNIGKTSVVASLIARLPEFHSGIEHHAGINPAFTANHNAATDDCACTYYRTIADLPGSLDHRIRSHRDVPSHHDRVIDHRRRVNACVRIRRPEQLRRTRKSQLRMFHKQHRLDEVCVSSHLLADNHRRSLGLHRLRQGRRILGKYHRLRGRVLRAAHAGHFQLLRSTSQFRLQQLR